MLGWWFPENVLTDGGVFHLLYWSSAVAMLIVQALLSRVQRPARVRSVRLREVVWAIVPALLLLGFGIASFRSPTALAAGRAQLPCEIVPASVGAGTDGAAR
jgi:hypothetical protein